MTALERAADYLRQIGPGHELAIEARAALLRGDVPLAYALVWALQGTRLGNLEAACADYARREIRSAWTPELPSRMRARFEAWARETGWRGP